MATASRTHTDDRNIYLVHPTFPPSYWGMEHLFDIIPYDAILPPLGMLTVGALTPPDFQVTLCDENAGEEVDYDTPARIVCLTGYLNQMPTVFAHADQFRARGKLVAIGGPIANLMPEACRPHCDVL